MADENVLQKLKTALEDLSKFLTDHQTDLKQLVKSVGTLFPPIVDVIDALVGLLKKLQEEIKNIDLGPVQSGVAKITDFAQKATDVLGAIKAFRPDIAGDVDEVEKVVKAVSELPSLTDLKDALTKAIQEVIDALGNLTS